MRPKPFGKRAQASREEAPATAPLDIALLKVFRRRAPRRITWASCTLFAGAEQMAGMCVDISATGARIRFSEDTFAPPEGRIVSAQLGLQREARLVRTEGADAAYQFTD